MPLQLKLLSSQTMLKDNPIWVWGSTSLDILHQFCYNHNSQQLNRHEKLWLSRDFKLMKQKTTLVGEASSQMILILFWNPA